MRSYLIFWDLNGTGIEKDIVDLKAISGYCRSQPGEGLRLLLNEKLAFHGIALLPREEYPNIAYRIRIIHF